MHQALLDSPLIQWISDQFADLLTAESDPGKVFAGLDEPYEGREVLGRASEAATLMYGLHRKLSEEARRQAGEHAARHADQVGDFLRSGNIPGDLDAELDGCREHHSRIKDLQARASLCEMLFSAMIKQEIGVWTKDLSVCAGGVITESGIEEEDGFDAEFGRAGFGRSSGMPFAVLGGRGLPVDLLLSLLRSRRPRRPAQEESEEPTV